MNEVYSKDLGIVTAYGYALSKGYTGTEDEFAALMADYATVGQQAVDAALAAEGYALGTHNGEPVPSTDPAYHNNAKYYAEQLEPALDALDYALAAFPTATLADRPIASFDDGADDIPVKDLTVSIEPVQAGSGDPTPDNVRPITGWTGANIARTGKNLFNCPTTASTSGGVTSTPNGDGSLTLEGDADASPFNRNIPLLFPLPPNTTCTITLNNAEINAEVGVRLLDTTSTTKFGTQVLADATNKSATVTVSNTWTAATAINIFVRSNHSDVSAITLKVQVELGDTATAWEAYNGDTHSVSWESEAGTVYGGTLDVTTGVLTVTHKSIKGSTLGTWAQHPNYATQYRKNFSDANTGGYAKKNGYRNIFSDSYTTGNSSDNNTIFGFSESALVTIHDNRFESDPVGFTAAIADVQFVYELETPLTYQLTPTEVKSLLGENHIAADTGNVSVTYRADPTLFINDKVAALTALMSES